MKKFLLIHFFSGFFHTAPSNTEKVSSTSNIHEWNNWRESLACNRKQIECSYSSCIDLNDFKRKSLLSIPKWKLFTQPSNHTIRKTKEMHAELFSFVPVYHTNRWTIAEKSFVCCVCMWGLWHLHPLQHGRHSYCGQSYSLNPITSNTKRFLLCRHQSRRKALNFPISSRTVEHRQIRQKVCYIRLSICRILRLFFFSFIGLDGGENWRRANPHLHTLTRARTQTYLPRTISIIWSQREREKRMEETCFVCLLLGWCCMVPAAVTAAAALCLSHILDREARETGVAYGHTSAAMWLVECRVRDWTVFTALILCARRRWRERERSKRGPREKPFSVCWNVVYRACV